MISPPRILLIGITGILALVVSLVQILAPITEIFSITYGYWITVFILVVLAFLLSIPSKFYNRETLNALLTLPKAFASMFLSLFKLKGANKKFIHTQHGTGV